MQTSMIAPASLMEMLRYKRPMGSSSERKFVNRFLRPLGVTTDEAGNVIKRIGAAPVLWSSHTDTVHKASGKQHVALKDGWLTAPWSDCLGGDCTAGVWLMVEMIKAEVPGLYIFHYGEERGGVGSSFIADNTPELLKGLSYAIAFDRRDFTSVITEQYGGVCSSNAFARSLAAQLGPRFEPDPSGVFTDTANYRDFIPECTNISVGFQNEHSSRERLHLEHLVTLRDALLNLDLSKLVVARDPTAKESTDDFYARYEKEFRKPYGSFHSSKGQGSYYRLLEAIQNHPDAVASVMETYGLSAEDIYQEVNSAWSNYDRR